MNKFVAFLASIGKALFRPWYPVKIVGPRKLPQKRTLLLGNHISGWDPVVFQIWLKTWVSFVYKAEFRKSRTLRWVFDGLDLIPVRRGEVDLSATKSILKHLRDEKIVGLFPEGTRNPNVGTLQEFHTGAALFALKTKTPIRPFYIWDKTKALHKNYIVIGDEFDLEQFYGQPITKELLQEATQVIKSKIDELCVKLDGDLAAKGKKRRKLTKKEIAKINAYNERQKTLAKQIAAQQAEQEQASAEEQQ